MSDAATNSHLDRLKRIAQSPQAVAIPENESEDSYSAFASGRVGTKPQLTLTLRQVSGNAHAFAYAHLYSIEFNPSLGIRLQYTLHQVTLQGRNLDDLFRYLCQHRVQTVLELDPLQAETLARDEAVITKIELQPARPTPEPL